MSAHVTGEVRPWCGAAAGLGGQQPCPVKSPCGPGDCAIGQATGNETYRARYEADAESTSAALRRVQAELAAERDKRDEDIAAYERACGLAVVAERERDRLAAAVDDLHADLNNAQQECDSAQTEVQVLRRSESLELVAAENRAITAERDRDLARAELVSARTELDAVRTVRDNLDRQLAAARAEIADLDRQLTLCPRCGIAINADITDGRPALASWIVARDGGRDCASCGQEIRRGEAYDYMPSTDLLKHIHCPDRAEESETT